MKLPGYAMDQRAFTWMLVIFLSFMGGRSLLRMPRTENPEVTVPGASVIVVMPGRDPRTWRKWWPFRWRMQ
ncbi:MAG: hypothetical protein R2751_19145 [Bacteroidales bacterium]